MNEQSGVLKLQRENAANEVQIQCAAPWEVSPRRRAFDLWKLAVHRHDRESHVAHMEIETLAHRSGEEHVLLAIVLCGQVPLSGLEAQDLMEA